MEKTRYSLERLKLGHTTVSVALLINAKWNYKEEDEEKSEKLYRQIKRNKQIVNINIRELGKKYEVIDGNHRLPVFQKLKYEKCFVYNHSKITKAQAMRIAIELNETKFESNQIKLAENIVEISKEFSLEELETTMPYSMEELQSMETMLSFDWDQYKTNLDDIEKPKTTKCPECGNEFEI